MTFSLNPSGRFLRTRGSPMFRLLALLIPLIVPMVLLALTSPRDGAPPRADNTGADRAPASGPALGGPVPPISQ
jgi:hypothetical protein